jgi:hypothetical protein
MALAHHDDASASGRMHVGASAIGLGREEGREVPWGPAETRRGCHGPTSPEPTCNPNPTWNVNRAVPPSGLKFANLFAVRYSSTPLYSFASEIITARSTVRVELQSEIHIKPHVHVIPEGKNIPVGLTDVGSTAPLLARHVRPRHCAVQRFLRLARVFLV